MRVILLKNNATKQSYRTENSANVADIYILWVFRYGVVRISSEREKLGRGKREKERDHV